MPLADVGGVIAGVVERGGHGGQFGRQTDAVGHHSGLVGIAAAQQRAAERRAPRRAGHRAIEAHALAAEVVEVGGGNVGVAAVAGGLGAVLVAKDPQHVGPPHWRQHPWVIHLAPRIAAARPRCERETSTVHTCACRPPRNAVGGNADDRRWRAKPSRLVNRKGQTFPAAASAAPAGLSRDRGEV